MDNTASNGEGHVDQIRRQWVVHEDEALAYKLQNEEITQHYSGNRFRNATVREDLPRAREEQEREEREALEERFRQLKIRQLQDEEDEKVAKMVAAGADNETLLGAAALPIFADDLDFDILDKDLDADGHDGSFEAGEARLEELKRVQEERDEKFARRLQEELEQHESDKLMAIESQDRELAKMIYLKEKAKIKRARERAKLKAEASATSSNSSASAGNGDHDYSPSPGNSSDRSSSGRSSEKMPSPPQIPEKLKVFEPDDPIRFRAVPKSLPLPPSPSQPNSANCTSPFDRDPVPPYMPMQGFKIQNKRK